VTAVDVDRRTFLEEHANWNGLRRIYVTFDVDWAPDYMIENALAILDGGDVRATFFATHDSPLLRSMAAAGRHEVGIHPYVSPQSSQGDTIDKVLDGLLSAYPGARGCRFHLLGGSYRDKMRLASVGIRYEASTLLYRASHLQPVFHRDIGLLMTPYCWEDGIAENAGERMRLAALPLHDAGLKIFNFHPMNAFINGATADVRRTFLAACGPLQECPESVARASRHEGEDGAECVLKQLVAMIGERGIATAPLGDLWNAAAAAGVVS